jgi:septal ring factor EnvC (AmiA/AmiB activator)
VKLFNKYTLLVLLLISIGFNYYEIFIDDPLYIKQYEDTITKLETEIDSININNIGLKSQVLALEDKIDTLDLELTNIEDKRKSIIRSYEIYLQQITDLNDSELERWLLSRYNN